jgi:nucleoid-associated protein YgaU
MIASNSRYAQSNVVVTNDLDGNDIQAIVPSEQISYSFNYQYYLVVVGDSLQAIAANFYSDPTLWWVIADANPEVLLWDTLTAGVYIRVPVSA